MKTGDMVRFKTRVHQDLKGFSFPGKENWKLGLLVEYHTWEKVATILHEGRFYRVRAEQVQKAGKRDFETREEKHDSTI